MMWIALAMAPLAAAWTVGQTPSAVSQTHRPMPMRPHALTSTTTAGHHSLCRGRVSVVMQEESVTPETTAENLFLTRIRKHWGYGLALIAVCLFARDSATSKVGGLVQVGIGFVRSNYKGMIAVTSAHKLLTEWGVLGMFPKIFGVASTEDIKTMRDDMNAGFAEMNAGFAELNASIRSISETISETVKKDSQQEVR